MSFLEDADAAFAKVPKKTPPNSATTTLLDEERRPLPKSKKSKRPLDEDEPLDEDDDDMPKRGREESPGQEDERQDEGPRSWLSWCVVGVSQPPAGLFF